ncbi:DUF559 domain-containing protein [Thermoanaerobacterium thermosaccharolyticum]|uniref:endonuclease domain-containing protein n=1 Tax=Thermoanaerobacterium thermosaccharolyticum TaxID=1517 RepID=UPI003D298938
MKKIYQDGSNDWNISAFEVAKKLEPRVKQYFDKIMESTASNYLIEISECESPIEQLLGLALQHKLIIFEVKSDYGVYAIYPQYEIDCFGKKYRVDFYINVTYEGQERNIVIECDGHDFHEKTKEQAARDKQKDRYLARAGYKVIRFTGSEIWADPDECAREVLSVVFSQSY